jgi:hypothetical protein
MAWRRRVAARVSAVAAEPRLDRRFEPLRFDERSGIVACVVELIESLLESAEVRLLRREAGVRERRPHPEHEFDNQA